MLTIVCQQDELMNLFSMLMAAVFVRYITIGHTIWYAIWYTIWYIGYTLRAVPFTPYFHSGKEKRRE